MLQILDRVGSKQLSCHLRSFSDVLVNEFSKSGGSGHVHKCIEAMNLLVWEYSVVPLDRLILCIALRPNEGNEAQVIDFCLIFEVVPTIKVASLFARLPSS